jgi:hypothetical protein
MARKKAVKQSNTTILILVEGETEQIYFDQFRCFERRQGITIKPKLAKHSDPQNIIKQAIDEQKEHIYDHIWCVFDCDVLKNQSESFERMYQQAKTHKIHFAESMPCFEVWFLAHYAVPKHHYPNQDAVINALQHYIEQYSKKQNWLRKTDIYKLLKPHQKEAIEKASALPEINHHNPATGTSVYILIASLLS